jgi:hypothetical protein
MSENDRAYCGGIQKELTAALDEMKFWLRIMQEHAGLIRNGLDPTENKLFLDAERFFLEIGPLREDAEKLVYSDTNREMIEELIEESLHVVGRLRDFKRNLTALLAACRVKAILPTALVDHIRREADFFLGELHFVRGEPTPNKETIGIPDSNERALTVPRLLIPEMPNQIYNIALQESLFLLRQNTEHADVLALYFRPAVQDDLLKTTQAHSSKLHEVYNEALEVNKTGQGLNRLLMNGRQVVSEWDAFLRKLYDDVIHCQVPTGQTNLWPILDDHLAREAEYYLDVVQIIFQVKTLHGLGGDLN